jgi:8-hydroxy-5-deazaflavin:NADPH oxidoreductase
MAKPKLDGQRALLFYCGDHGDAKSIVAGLAKELEFDARDAGPLRQACLLEPLALLWIRWHARNATASNSRFK